MARAASGPLPPAGRVQLPPVVHFLALPPEPVRLPPEGALVPSIDLAYSSVFQRETADRGLARFEADLELLTLTPRLAWRPADRLALGVALPLHLFGSGFLDRPIQEYHELFDLDDGDRGLARNDAFASRLVVDGRLVYEGEQRFGPGDLAFTQAWRLARGERGALALRTAIELPTGEADRGFGSGEVDLAAALAGTVEAGRLVLHGQLGWSLPGDLAGASRVRTHAAYGAGLVVEAALLRDRLVALAGLEGRTPFASGSGLDVFDAPLVQGSLGIAMRVGGAWATLGVAEDVRTGSAPDVTFLIRLSPALD